MTGADARPTIGLVIPTFNRGPLIERAIDSVIDDGFDAIVVADDGSTDDTADLVNRHPQVTYVRQPNAGANAARNLGVEHLDTDFVTFLDSDDQFLPGFVAAHRDAMSTDTDVITSGFVREDPDGTRRTVMPEPLGPAFDGQVGCFSHGGTYVVRRSVFRTIGGFDVEMPAAQHTEFALRLLNRMPPPSVTVLDDAHCVYFARRADGIRADPRRVGRGAAGLLERHADALARDPERFSDHAGVAARGALLEGDGRRARHYAFLAVKAMPRRGRAWGRLGLAMLPEPVRQRLMRARST